MQKGGYYMIRTIRSGRVIEKSLFWVSERKPRKDRRKGSSSLAKKDRNSQQAVRRFARVLNCNMSAGDLLITLTYDDKHLPESKDVAEKEAALFMRRLSRRMEDISPAGVWITADKDEKTGTPARIHHHMVLKKAGIENSSAGGKTLEQIWKKGFVDIEPLEDQEDYTPVAAYLLRQAIDEPDAKRWHSTQGLKKPELLEEKIVSAARELRAPGGALVEEIGKYDAETGSHYIRYVRRKDRNDYERMDPLRGASPGG